jgi:polysaccharide export outer membrane protein
MVGAVFLVGCASSSGNSDFAPAAYVTAQQGGVRDAAARADAAAEAAKAMAEVSPGNKAYKIGPLDVLEVSVFRVPELTKTVQVSDLGTIYYPVVGEIKAGGKTAQQLEHDLAKKLSNQVQSPQVSVLVREYNSQRITIEGSVKTPNVYAMKGPTSLVQAMAMAGGIDADIASGDIVVFRTIDGVRSAARFDLDSVKNGAAPDPQLQPNDVVIVDTSTSKVYLNRFLKVLPIATTAAYFSAL